jgi:hypothetical protein
LRLPLFELALEDLSGAGDGVALVVKKTLDPHGHLDVAAAVETLAGAAFVWFELGKFALPEAEDVGRNVAELSYFADAEVKLVRDVRSRRRGGFADWLMLRHARNSVTALLAVVAVIRLQVSIGQPSDTVCNFPGWSCGSYEAGVETGWRGSVFPRALRRYWAGQVVDWWRTAAA